MIITTLLENTRMSSEFKNKHGLCLHIKTKHQSVLFDVGSNGLFIENAKKLNVNIEKIDVLVISHGHRDHGGGIREFLKINEKAKIYINEKAFEKYYADVLGVFKGYIGLDQELKNHKNIIIVKDDYRINDELMVFSKIDGNRFLPEANKSLYVKKDRSYILDDFSHEQNLIVSEGDKNVIISGCSHRGIVNIVEQGSKLMDGKINTVIGGFHLYNPTTKKGESVDMISNIGNELMVMKTKYYTCHCTGEKPYSQLKEIMGEQIEYISTGKIFEV